MRLYITCLVLFISVVFGKLYAQDIHFSQFFNTPLTINPASTGDFDGNWRIMNIYRRQWDALNIPFITTDIGFDYNIFLNQDKLSVGLVYLNDKAGGASINSNKIYLSAAYHKKLGTYTLSGGLQAGYSSKTYGANDFTYPDQYNSLSGKYDGNMPTTGLAANQNIGYADLNAGIQIQNRFGKIEPKLGLALYHVNQPNESFISNTNKLPTRYNVQLGVNVYLSSRFYLSPHAMYLMLNEANNLVSGMNATYVLSETGALRAAYIGTYFRNGVNRNSDAVIPVIGLRFNHFDLGVSYDFNISDLKQYTNNKGALEISLIYTNLINRKDKVYIPCDLF